MAIKMYLVRIYDFTHGLDFNTYRTFTYSVMNWEAKMELFGSGLIGVKNADENELRSIASDPDEIHMYNVNDFSFMLDIVDDLTENLCNSVKGPGKFC